MGLYSPDVATLVDNVIDRINVEAGFVEFELEDGRIFAIQGELGSAFGDSVVLIDGELEGLIDSPVEEAFYDDASSTYFIETFFARVAFAASGPNTGFFEVME